MTPGIESKKAARAIIAGGGPVGLVAALALARHGVASIVIEADADVCEGSRATCISRRSLQVLERLGADAAFIAKGLGWTQGSTYLGTHEVFQLKMSQTDDDRFPPFINMGQNTAERLLVAACEATGLVDIRWRSRVTAVRQSNTNVALDVERDGTVETLNAEWVIAADGARSAIREALGLKLEGLSFHSRYLIADIKMRCDWPTERKVWFDPVSNPGSTVIMHRQPDDIWRIDYQLRSQDDSERELQEDRVHERVAAHLKMVGLTGEWRLIWKSLYQARALSLPRYVHGRVLFVGDAAHLVPIFGVRGLNSGIDDAGNLGWKLALILSGLAGESLMESFNKERHDAYLENIENAIKTTWFMSPPSAGFVLARDAALELATRHKQFSTLIDPRQSSAHRYRSDAIAENPACPLVGLSLPELRLSDGSSIYRYLGTSFSTLRIGTGDKIVTTDRHYSGVPMRDIEIPDALLPAEKLGIAPDDILLLRPDGYVAAFDRDVAALQSTLVDFLGQARAEPKKRMAR
jgi:3-(3-hydroxy-phenyl)propionate hydroxylase